MAASDGGSVEAKTAVAHQERAGDADLTALGEEHGLALAPLRARGRVAGDGGGGQLEEDVNSNAGAAGKENAYRAVQPLTAQAVQVGLSDEGDPCVEIRVPIGVERDGVVDAIVDQMARLGETIAHLATEQGSAGPNGDEPKD